MSGLFRFTSLAAALVLVACGSGGKDEEKKAADEMPAAEESMAEKGAMDSMMEKASEMAEAIKLDTSSLSAFKESLSSMKASLSAPDASKLTDALGKLAKGAVENKDDLMGAAKGMMSGKSLEETLYEKMGEKLDGLTFEDVLALAG